MALLAASSQSLGLPRCRQSAFRSQTPSSSSSSRAALLPRPASSRASSLLSTRRARHASALFGEWQGKAHLGTGPDFASLVQAGTAPQVTSGCRRRVPCSPSASLFGVGAPEALVIGVVALIVFGPKGLAEVARNIGKTLRTFQPTIRELQEVTRDFKETLQQEIGLDDIRNPSASSTRTPPSASTTVTPTYTSNPGTIAASSTTSDAPLATAASKAEPQAYSADDMARITEEQIKRAMEVNTVTEEARRASELAAWKGNPPSSAAASSPPPPAVAASNPAPAGTPSPPPPAAATDAPKAQSPASGSVQPQSAPAPKPEA